jgi:hypothetical protein
MLALWKRHRDSTLTLYTIGGGKQVVLGTITPVGTSWLATTEDKSWETTVDKRKTAERLLLEQVGATLGLRAR